MWVIKTSTGTKASVQTRSLAGTASWESVTSSPPGTFPGALDHLPIAVADSEGHGLRAGVHALSDF